MSSPSRAPGEGRPDSPSEELRTYVVAMLILGVSFGRLAVFVLRGDLQGMKELAAIADGWVGGVIGFYFSRQQARYVAAVSTAESETSARELQEAVRAMKEHLKKADARVERYEEQALNRRESD